MCFSFSAVCYICSMIRYIAETQSVAIKDDNVVYHRAGRGQHRYLRARLYILYRGGQTGQAETVNG